MWSQWCCGKKARLWHSYPHRIRIQKPFLMFIVVICVLTTCILHQIASGKTNLLTASKTNVSWSEIEALATPFPSAAELSSFSDISGLPPFEIDVVYSYGGYRNDSTNIHHRDNGELRYSLRSVFSNMPWFRRIYIVCPDELALNGPDSPLFPPWLDRHKMGEFETPSNGMTHSISFVSQSSLFADPANALNNNNSNAFEVVMHRIPGLSSAFIYLCDDFFIGRPLSWTFFYKVDDVTGITPRVPLSVFEKYFRVRLTLSGISRNYRNPHWYPTTYDCDITLIDDYWKELREAPLTSLIPPRVERYESHAPRPLTKELLTSFRNKYPKWFEFVESHKERYCCPATVRGFLCNRQEGLWLPLYKQYIDFEIKVDVMQNPPSGMAHYYCRNSDCIHPEIERLLELRPYTFSINDYYSEDHDQYLSQVTAFRVFCDTYWPQKAVFEK